MGKKKNKGAKTEDAPKVEEAKFTVEKLNEGEGEICPTGAFVTAHYHGTLQDGTVFDSSVQKNQPFEFQVGQGQVIRAWDEAIVQMKKGQKAKLTCPPDYAYGEEGAGGVIPPNATLTFEVELLDFYMAPMVSHILLKHKDCLRPSVPHKGNKAVTRTKEEAIESIKKIKESLDGGMEFGKCAMIFSECSSSMKMGQLGFLKKNTMDADFEKASYALK